MRKCQKWEKKILKCACIEAGFVLKIWRKSNIKGGHVLCKNLYLVSSGPIWAWLISHLVTDIYPVIGRKESGRGRCRNISANRGEHLQKLVMPLPQICEVSSHKVNIPEIHPAVCGWKHLIGQIYGFTSLLNTHSPLHGWCRWCLYEEAIVHLVPQTLRDRSEYKPPSGSLTRAPKRGDGEQRHHRGLHEWLVKIA